MQAVQAFIERSGLEVGGRLPAERELMLGLGVGRSTIREAISRMQALGLVEPRKGSGTYLLRRVSAGAVHLPLTIHAPDLATRLLQTLDVRRGLEGEAGALAALRRTAGDLELIETRLVEMERVHLDKGTSGREDLAFHLSVYEAAHNPLFGQLLEGMREAFESFFDRPWQRSDFARRSFPFHRQLFEAIRDGDAGAARDRTLAILAVVEEDIREMAP